MTIRRVVLVLLALGLVSSVVLQRAAHAAGPFRVSSELSRAGEVFSRPVLLVEPGETGVLEVTGDPSYRYQVVVTEKGERSVEVALRLRIGDETLSPVVVTGLGQEAQVVVGDWSVKVLVEPQ